MACSNPLEVLQDPIGCAGQALGGAVSSVAASGMDAFANAMGDMLGKALQFVATVWESVPAPDLNSTGSVVHVIDRWTYPLAGAAMVIGLIVAGAKLAWQGRFEEDGKAVIRGILYTVAVVGAGGTLITALLAAFEVMAHAVLHGGINQVDVGKRLIAFGAGTSTIPVLGSGLGAMLFILAGLGSLSQAAFVVLRGPVLVLLTGMWPVGAASAVTKQGSDFFRRISAWIVSWTIYKLLAALVYATAFGLIGQSKDLGGTVSGLLLLTLAGLTLPALIRLITPAAQAIPGGGSVAAGFASAGIVGSQAMGAAHLGGGRATAQPVQAGGAVTSFSKPPAGPTGAAAAGPAAGAASGAALAGSVIKSTATKAASGEGANA